MHFGEGVVIAEGGSDRPWSKSRHPYPVDSLVGQACQAWLAPGSQPDVSLDYSCDHYSHFIGQHSHGTNKHEYA
jgi:hypothetical protein